MNTIQEVTSLMAQRFGVEEDKITAESKIAEDLGADSLDVVDLLMDIEDKFTVSVPDEDIPSLVTVGDVVSYIESHKE